MFARLATVLVGILLLLGQGSLGLQTSLDTGVLSGVLIDQNGNAVSGAQVYAMEPGIVSKVMPVFSDKEGKFEIDSLKFGRYRVFTSKEENNYPDSSAAFYADAPSIVELRRSSPIVHVTITLPAQGATLTGDVRDADTGMPLPGAQIRLSRGDNPSRWIQVASNLGDAQFRVLVPTDHLVDVKVSKAGYHIADFKDQRFTPNEERVLNVRLSANRGSAVRK